MNAVVRFSKEGGREESPDSIVTANQIGRRLFDTVALGPLKSQARRHTTCPFAVDVRLGRVHLGKLPITADSDGFLLRGVGKGVSWEERVLAENAPREVGASRGFF